jgi:NTE family protein
VVHAPSIRRCLAPAASLLFAVLATSPMFLSAETAAATSDRPRVGLVLSGGGAKGAAHVGVIKILERLGVPVDFVVGTSMGAIVGGLYASGMTADELEGAIRDIDWVDIFNDDPPRAERSFRRKQDDSEVLVRYRIGYGDGELKVPRGVILGQKLDLTLRRLAARAAHRVSFDDLQVPFRAVATNLETGEPVILDSGNLALAMRASMSVPGVFPPVEYQDKLLIDGGIANNLPVDVTRSMGADVLIVVNVQSPPRRRENLKSVLGIIDQTINLMVLRETQRQLELLDPVDVLIEPELGDIDSTDFLRAVDAIATGEAAAEASRAELRSLAVRARNGLRLAQAPPRTAAKAPVISSIRIENDTPLDDEVLRSRLRARQGEPLDVEALEEDISQIYGLGYFETVDYELINRGYDSDLIIKARQKSIGLNTVRFGLNLESDFNGESIYNFALSHERLGVNGLGAEWRNAVVFGDQTLFSTEFYQPVDNRQRWFVNAIAEYLEQDIGIFGDGRQTAEFRLRTATLGLDAGRAFGNCCEARLGVRVGAGESRLKTGTATSAGEDFGIGALVASLGYDTLDNVRFPNTGETLEIFYEDGSEALGADSPARALSVSGGIARTRGRHTLIGRVLVGANLNDEEDVQNLFSLGGLLNLSGFSKNEISGENAALANLVYYYRLRDYGTGKFGIPIYVGGSLEHGGVYSDLGDFGGDEDITAGAVLIGADTPLGPLYIAYGMAEGGIRSGYVFLGQTF